MAEEHEEGNTDATALPSSLPINRVKRIIKLDKEINKINAEALFIISQSTELFLQFLAERSSQVALEKKRKTIKLEHIRVAVKRHQPTSDFLLDSLPMPSQPVDPPAKERSSGSKTDDKPVPAGTRRIDSFFQKAYSNSVNTIEEAFALVDTTT